MLGQQLGQQADDLAQPDWLQARQAAPDGLCAQPGHHRCIGREPFGGVAVRHRHGVTLLARPRHELFRQPRLANTGIAPDQHTARPARGCGAPVLLQQAPFGLTPNQSRRARLCQGGRSLSQIGAQQPFVDCVRARARLDPQLVLEGGDTRVVDAQRGRAVTGQRMQAHERLAGCFVGRVELHQALAVTDGFAVGALRFELVDQTAQRIEGELAQPFTLRANPVGVAAGQQIAAVEGRRLFQGALRCAWVSRSMRLCCCLLELGHVGHNGFAGPPEQMLALHQQVVFDLRQELAQVQEEFTEVGASLVFVGVWPEEERNALARLRCIAVQGQKRHQFLYTRHQRGVQWEIADGEMEVTQEPDG